MLSLAQNEKLRVKRFTFISFVAFAIILAFSIHFWNRRNESMDYYKVVKLNNNTTIIHPGMKASASSSAIIARNRKSEISAPDIDRQRKILRLTERFNLMEDIYGANWTDKPPKSTECNIDYANTNRLQQDHPCVIELIRRHYLHEPAPPNTALNLKFPNHTNPSAGQSQAILRLLRNRTNGFFVESGGFNGEALSNTLYMERFLNWTGILIEPDTKTFPQLMNKNRKSWALPVCLSLENYPTKVTFNNTISGIGTVIINGDNKKITDTGPANPFTVPFVRKISEHNFSVQCFPLYSILVAVNRTSVDFLSLDVEGHEFRILKTVPFHKVDVETLSVEWEHVAEGEEAMSRYMDLHGFVRFGRISEAFTRDVVYIKDILEDYRDFYDY